MNAYEQTQLLLAGGAIAMVLGKITVLAIVALKLRESVNL